MARFAVLVSTLSLAWPLVWGHGQETCASDDAEVQETDDVGLLQMNPMHKHHGNSDKVLVWCTAGGGLRALAAAQGYASAFSRAGLFKRQDLTALGTASGGSWWLGHFAYDEDYFRKNLQPDRALFQAWLQDVWNSTVAIFGPQPSASDLPILGAPGQWLLYIFKVSQELGFDFQGMYDMITRPIAAYRHHYSWRQLSQALFQKQAVGQKPADWENRPVLQRPSLHFAVAGLANHFIEAGPKKPRVAWQLAANKSALAFKGGRNSGFIPMQWIVPGRPRVHSHVKRVAKLVTPPKSAVHWQARFMGLSDNYTMNPFKLQGDFQATREPTVVGALTVEQVVAMASANAAKIASPMVALQMLKFYSGSNATKLQALLDHESPFGFSIGEFFQGLTHTFGLNKMAVCGSPKNDLDDCEHPSKMFGDGGWLDNMAVAQTIADLQQHHCASKTLRMVLSDNSDGNRSTGNLGRFFSVDGAPSPGSFVPFYFDGTIRPTAQVFAAAWSDIVWQPLGATLGNGIVEYATLTTTTVKNPSFGVKGGQRVELLAFFAQTPSAPFFGDVSSYVGSALLTSDALVTDTLQDWLQGGSGTKE